MSEPWISHRDVCPGLEGHECTCGADKVNASVAGLQEKVARMEKDRETFQAWQDQILNKLGLWAGEDLAKNHAHILDALDRI